MRIYTKIVIDMKTDRVILAEYHSYEGPIASCEPITSSLAALSTALGGSGTALSGLTILGTGVGIVGDIVGGIQQSQQAAAEAAAKDAEAKQIMLEGKENKRRREKQAISDTGTQIAKFGMSGVLAPLDVIVQDLGKGYLAAADIGKQAQARANNAKYQAKLTRYNASGIWPKVFTSIAGRTVLGSDSFGGSWLKTKSSAFPKPAGAF